MAYSQNGFTAFADYGDPGLISNPTVPGADVKILGGVRSGPASVVLLHVAKRFHETVEPLAQEQGVWGFGPRNIRGSSTTLSNHASGTAIDLNSVRHPISSQGTFSSPQVVAIIAILAECRGVVRWGGNYSGRKDEMHFEINAPEYEVGAVAAILALGSIPIPEPEPAPVIPPAPTPTEELTMAQIDDIITRLDAIALDVHNSRTLLNEQEARLGNVVAPLETAVAGIRTLMNQFPDRAANAQAAKDRK